MQMKPIKLAVFDVDGTLTTESSVWEYLLKCLDKWDTHGKPNLDGYMNGLFDYEEFARRDALLYKDLSFDYLDGLVGKITRRAGVDDCLDWFVREDIPILLLSTGLSILLDQFNYPVSKIANELEFINKKCTGKVKINIAMNEKLKILTGFLNAHQINAGETVVVGDSFGDLDIMKIARYSIAVCPNDQAVAEVADYTLDDGELSKIPEILKKAGLSPNFQHSVFNE